MNVDFLVSKVPACRTKELRAKRLTDPTRSTCSLQVAKSLPFGEGLHVPAHHLTSYEGRHSDSFPHLQ